MRNEFLKAAALTVAALAYAGAGVAADVHWTYHGEESPIEWCELDPTFVKCCEGAEQTPVPIDSRSAENAQLSPLLFDYLAADMVATNNGHTVQVNVPAGTSSLTVNGTTYNLLQFHWHTPSEHFLDGEEYPIEMHLVHKSTEGKLLVVGVFIKEGAANAELNKIFSVMPGIGSPDVNLTNIDVNKMLPALKWSYRYDGSLTTPPCTEGVKWNVLATPITATKEQIELFTSVFHGAEFPDGNRRGLKPLNGRVVLTDLGRASGCNPTGGDGYKAADMGVLGGLAVLLLGAGAVKRMKK